MSTKVDTGTPPDSVSRKQKIQNLIMSGETIDSEDTPPPDPVEHHPVKTSYTRVKLVHKLYKLELPVLDVSVAEHQVAIRLPNNGVKFEPSELNGDFVVTYMGSEYKVAYLGGIFEFPADNSWVIAFIRDKRSEESELDYD